MFREGDPYYKISLSKNFFSTAKKFQYSQAHILTIPDPKKSLLENAKRKCKRQHTLPQTGHPIRCLNTLVSFHSKTSGRSKFPPNSIFLGNVF